MTIRIRTRSDITLELVEAVAWRGDGLEIEPDTPASMDRCHDALEAFVAERVGNDPQALIYGVTSAPGDAAATALSKEGNARRPNRVRTRCGSWPDAARGTSPRRQLDRRRGQTRALLRAHGNGRSGAARPLDRAVE